MTKRAILHIPHSEMLVDQSIQYWIDRFESVTRTRPTEVVLPGVGYLGPTFDSKVYGYPTRLTSENLLPNWIRRVREALDNATPIWASIIPTYQFLEVETLMLQDQYGGRFDQACISNPAVQKITDEFIKEMAEWGIYGIVFDITDIYPNSSNDAYRGTQNPCFCSYCLKQLEMFDWNQRNRPFIGTKNISRFILSPTATGTAHIAPQHQWISDIDTAALMQISVSRKFLPDPNELTDEEIDKPTSNIEASTQDAEGILRYLSARGKITARSIRRLGKVAEERNLALAIILGDEDFDMTQCTDLAFLAEAEAANQYWLPAANSEFVQAKGISAVQYLIGKATYALNAFFEDIGDADETIANLGVDAFISRLLRVSRRVTSNRLNPGAVFAVELADEYLGFAGVPISQSDVVRYIEGLLTRGTLGQVVPRHVLDSIINRVKLATPEKNDRA